MILTIDVGNTNVVIGCVENGEVKSVCRLATNLNDLSSDYALKMRQSFEFDGIDYKNFAGAILSSVVPQLNRAIRSAVKKVTGLDCMVVGAGLKTGVNVKIDDPGTLAGDLITGAVGALAMFKPPIIVVDMGTATTITAIDKTGTYVGGCISPGPKISAEALSARTAQLPAISLESPKKAIGKNTIDAMRSGVMLGSACMVDGMIDRIDAELGGGATVVATGGIARFVLPMCRHAIEYDRDLLLKGLALLYENNRREK